MVTWLKAAHHTALNKNKIVVVYPGECLYMPAGFLPVFLPLPYDAEGKVVCPRKHQPSKGLLQQEQFSSVSVSLLMDAALDAQASQDIVQMALTGWTSGISRTPKTIRENARVQEWEQKLTAAISADAVA